MVVLFLLVQFLPLAYEHILAYFFSHDELHVINFNLFCDQVWLFTSSLVVIIDITVNRAELALGKSNLRP